MDKKTTRKTITRRTLTAPWRRFNACYFRRCFMRYSMLSCLFVGLIAFGACATSNNAKQVKAHFNIGVAKLHENDIQGAFVEFKKALELDPNDKESLNALGLVYLQLEDYDQAQRSLLKAVRSDSKYSEAYNNLGLVYVKLNKWKEASEAFSDALKNPLYATPDKAYNNLGYAQYRQGKYTEAISAFDESVKRNDTSQTPLYGLALAENAIGHYGDASVYLLRAIKLDPVYAGNVKKAYEDFTRKSLKASKQEQKDYTDFLEILNY
ncbi:MAG: tetratricopeptide repeat protein [Candidatus Magnetobacterium sp. LHC-1]|nr:tetratricopeptide repeat protein [Nitrospirota bacterium]